MRCIDDCKDCQHEKFDLKEFGLFGIDFLATKRIINRLLRPHGMKLRIKTRRDDGQSEVQIVKQSSYVQDNNDDRGSLSRNA